MYTNVPRYILETLKGEPVDFIVQSAHNYTKRTIGWIIVGISLFFLGTSLFPLLFSFPLFELFSIGSTTITVNEVPQTFTPQNPWLPVMFALIPALFSFVFTVPFLIALYKGLQFVRKKGPWYAGTNRHLIEFDGQKVNYFEWQEFDRNIQTRQKRDNTLDIILSRQAPHGITVLPQPHVQPKSHKGKHKPSTQVTTITINRNLFMNKLGILGLENGRLVLDMIRHNMER